MGFKRLFDLRISEREGGIQLSKKYLVSVLMLLTVLLVCGSVSWGAIGVYKWSASTTVPSTISYMLNMDADDVSGSWSVQVQIVPAAGGAAIKTFSYLYPDPMTKRGAHSVVWDGTMDGDGYAPQGDYKAVITAKAAPVTTTVGTAATPALKGIFTYAPDTYMAIAINNNVGSPWFGYIYFCIYHKGIGMVAPDGSGYTWSGFGNSWDGSSPWGLAIDASDNVWVSSRSGTLNQWAKKMVVFKPDLSARLNIGPFTYPDNDRYCDVLGPTNNVYLLDDTGRTSSTPYYGRINTYHGDATTVTTSTAMTDAILGSTTAADPAGWCLQGTKLMDPGDGSAPYLYAAARVGTNNANGAVCKYTIDWATGTPTLAWANTAIATVGPLCVGVTPDGSTMAITRQTATDGDEFWTFPVANASTVSATDSSVKKFGFTPPPDYNAGGSTTYTYTHNMVYFRYDTLGNIVSTFSHSNYETQGGYWGFFAPPDNGSTNTRTTGTISWKFPQPVITGTNGPVSISSCQSGATATATVNVTCADGIDKVSSVTIDFTQLGKAGQGVVTLSRSGSGTTGTFTTTFGVGSGVKVGDYTLPITVNSTHSELSPTTGTLAVKVAGVTVTGKVTNSKTGWEIAGATVSASTGTAVDFSTTTDANGNYTLLLNPGSYALTASSPSYGATTGGATSLTLNCNDNVTQNLQLDPMDIHTATGGCYYYSFGRAPSSKVCVVGSVSRLPQQGTGTQGLSGYYYIFDTLTNNFQNGVRINNWTGTPAQPTLKEGDLVCVEGNWDAPSGYYQGRITPTRPPVIVGTGTKAQPVEFAQSYMLNKDHPYGTLYHVYGKVSDPQINGVAPYGPYFKIDAPTANPNDTKVTTIMVRIDTPTTAGVATLPAAGSYVHVNGILSMVDVWQSDVLTVAKADDIYLISDNVNTIGDAKALADGAKIGMTKMEATVIGSDFVYVESTDRTAGLRIKCGTGVTLPTSGPGMIGTGDLVDFHGVMATSAQGEKYVTADLLQRSTQDQGASAKPLDALAMNNRAAASPKALGLFVKTWGTVSAVNSDNFIMSDGSAAPVKVVCGAAMEKPAVGDVVRVRGVASMDADGPVIYMRNERVDWTTGSADYQPLPFPGAFKYPREYIVAGPFKDANSTDETYRLTHDFIADATNNQYSETTIADSNPRPGGQVGNLIWSKGTVVGDHLELAASNHTSDKSGATFYAHIWVYSPISQDVAMRIGSDDSSLIVLSSSRMVNEFGGNSQIYITDPVKGRGETIGNDPVTYVPLAQGWNSILIKVENGTADTGNPCGVDIQFVDFNNPGAGGYGGANPLPGLGYLLEKPGS